MKVLVVGPALSDKGGVANYYNAVYPRLAGDALETGYLEIGSTRGGKSGIHLLTDQMRFWRELGRFAPDIVHLNPSLDLKSFLRDGLFLLQARMRGRRVLVFFRGWRQDFERTVERYFMWFFRSTYRRADRHIVLASAFAERLRDWGVRAPVIQGSTAVADEVIASFSVRQKEQQIRSADSISLLYLARLEPDKGVLQLIDAVIRLLQRGVRVTLTIAGDGTAMAAVRERIDAVPQFRAQLQVAGYVRGHVKQTLLESHHVYCFPTRYGEGMPNSVLEAMAFGLPVLTCPAGGIGDFFEAERMGVLLQDNAPATIAAGIEQLLADRDRLVGMARYNHRYACEHFLASTAAAMLQSQYHEMTGPGC